ncbi:hypothetical protein A9502_31655 [Klebsiella pneumoniae]|nr:hypothetical protein A9502_31655 [Klebsiella pneumoniae]
MLCSLIGFIIGMSLFGSVTFLPLYLQVVKDATPRGSPGLSTRAAGVGADYPAVALPRPQLHAL